MPPERYFVFGRIMFVFLDDVEMESLLFFTGREDDTFICQVQGPTNTSHLGWSRERLIQLLPFENKRHSQIADKLRTILFALTFS